MRNMNQMLIETKRRSLMMGNVLKLISLQFASLAKLARTVANHNVDDDRLVAILLVETLLGIGDELLIEVVANQVDGAATKAATHDA